VEVEKYSRGLLIKWIVNGVMMNESMLGEIRRFDILIVRIG
jgi:hypothetical protein